MIFYQGYDIDNGSDKADYSYENIDAVGDFLGSRVNDREHEKRTHQRLTQEHINREPFNRKAKHKKQAVGKFYQRLLDADSRPATVAPSAQEKPAENGYQLIPVKTFPAGHTVGIDLNDALALRQAIYADIQKTAENNSV